MLHFVAHVSIYRFKSWENRAPKNRCCDVTSSKRSREYDNTPFASNSGFLNELEVSLKSVLLNSPLDYDMEIHLLVDEAAHKAVSERLIRTKIEGSSWRNHISILFHPVSDRHIAEWMHELHHKHPGKDLDQRMGAGGYFRLFADRILPNGTGHVLYLDNEIVVMLDKQPALAQLHFNGVRNNSVAF